MEDYTRAQWYLEVGCGTPALVLPRFDFSADWRRWQRITALTQWALDFFDQAAKVRIHVRSDSVEGVFGFSQAKEAYYSGSSLMWLPEKRALQIAADRSAVAIEAWQHEPVEQRSLDDEALAHLYRATVQFGWGTLTPQWSPFGPSSSYPRNGRSPGSGIGSTTLSRSWTTTRGMRSRALRRQLATNLRHWRGSYLGELVAGRVVQVQTALVPGNDPGRLPQMRTPGRDVRLRRLAARAVRADGADPQSEIRGHLASCQPRGVRIGALSLPRVVAPLRPADRRVSRSPGQAGSRV